MLLNLKYHVLKSFIFFIIKIFENKKSICLFINKFRDIETYIKLAKDRGAVIKYIFLTHFHADFVSGHQDLQK